MNFLIVDKVHPILVEILNKHYIQCDIYENIDYNKAFDIIENYEGLIIRSKFKVDEVLIKRAKKLKIIGRVGSGMENIDVEFAEKSGIVCFNSPEGNRNAVAEHAVGLVLNLLNNICKSFNEIKQGIWLREANRGIELRDKTVGIIGFGNTGSQFAKKLVSFECRILAYDKYKSGFANSFVSEVTLKDIQQYADIISFHVPLTSETKHYLNNTFIDACAKPFYVINTSRGSVVNTQHLYEALIKKKILGAALDVIEYEDLTFESSSFPEVFYKLIELPNVIVTPHIAGWTHESYKLLSEVLAHKIVAFIAHENR
ncbi:MAG: NAD(P)-binding domain-containing protein [Bacteroidales bacterium]|nr:NAD(P)-binding domain-containing protein [Bacteroidales bacterium]